MTGAVTSASGTSRAVRGGGIGQAERFLYPAEWSPEPLWQRAGEAMQPLRTGLRVPSLGQVGLGQRCSALAWGPAHRGHTVGFVQRGFTLLNLQQLLHCLEGDEG